MPFETYKTGCKKPIVLSRTLKDKKELMWQKATLTLTFCTATKSGE